MVDMHMPMHVGDNKDKGGNQTQVRFYDKGTNMHRLWDTDMIERTGHTEEFWLADLGQLDTPEARAAAMKGTVEDWFFTIAIPYARSAVVTANDFDESSTLSESHQALKRTSVQSFAIFEFAA
jgi:S1/P1 Nuclease